MTSPKDPYLELGNQKKKIYLVIEIIRNLEYNTYSIWVYKY